MANLTPTAGLSDVYQLETTDPVQGGAGGISNRQAQQLLNRLEYVRLRLANIQNGGGTLVPFAKVSGLGSAAAANTGLSAGQVMLVGSFGLGGPATSVVDVNTGFAPGLNIVQAGAANMPAGETSWAALYVLQGTVTAGGLGNVFSQFLVCAGRFYFRQFFAGAWTGWIGQGINEDVGQVAAFADTASRAGWLKCNGATVSRTTYAFLFARIGTTYGAGDGSTTFQLPDLRGKFVRSWDDSAGIDTGRVFGSSQEDAFESHGHGFQNIASGGGFAEGVAFTTTTGAITGSPTAGNITFIGDVETRPKNVALQFMIKYR